MKLITAIVALALLAGSMDVEAQKRGKVGKPGDSDDDAPQIAPVAHMAIGAFGVLDPEERKGLAEAAEGGDEEALGELRADRVEAIEAMIEALQDEDARQMIGLGIMLAQITMADRHGEGGKGLKEGEAGIVGLGGGMTAAEKKGAFMDMGGDMIQGDAADGMLDMVQERLEAQLNIWGGDSDDIPTEW